MGTCTECGNPLIQGGSVENNECELACDELGIKVVTTFDPVMYDATEIEEINEMFVRVLESWHRRRNMVFADPRRYGFEVH
jgi:hypothetical protein